MPLIILCGFPSSGKSTIALKLVKHFADGLNKNVFVVGDNILNINKNEVYNNSQKEKDLRGTLKSFVQRHLSTDNLVILDSLNYIKGFRYELFCVSKSCQTPQCVIHVATSIDNSQVWNFKQNIENQYDEQVFTGLIKRFEFPDSRNRWDSPLFTIAAENDIPFDDIFQVLYVRKALPPNASTQSQPLSDTNFLQELDKITQKVIMIIIDAQKTSVIGDYVSVPNARDKIHLIKYFTLPELQRKRRQFITFTKTHTVDLSKLINMFVHFINKVN